MPSAYLTPAEATQSLGRYNIVGAPGSAYLELASDILDNLGGFVGSKYAADQHRAFPRDVAVQDDAPGAVPTRILDWVAIRAHELSLEDEEAPVKSEHIKSLGASYARPKRAQTERIKPHLLRPYRMRSARIV